MTRYGMAIDLSRCIGCNTCAVACKVSNNLPKDVWWNVVHTEGRDFADTSKGTYGGEMQLSWLPVNCMHCENAVCEEVCPTGATVKRDDGIVTVDEETCIGCKSCMEACPYDVRRLIENEPEYYLELPIGDPAAKSHKGGTVEKCDFCAGRIDRGEKPACMELCPGRARYWGDLDDPESEVSQFLSGRNATVLLEEEGTSPSVYYVS
ncbi:4Fe-4S dicluster domain-containing protein [Adlercreutzia equolifaciens]|jgi:molybdopterin-containing oxidoreductase family iron-sulfur binding subunit|uniref:4Fe-4S ferredoxin n=1 Tax=Adlercreutzia equolifaciens subsp. celatus TaxID=394340 RepID=A0A369P6V3_9ACTN|nr:4Fe-4S dicluster domain-containing protein [Adlercreutzia equolifaciens]MED9826714.1 4Fe-4S dicluster domain-containing protein [Adlercreutzia sp.]RDC46889.1 4Fe-4S ferredoxin [Adlercreutzia equolifaciens subsp. celatus]